MSTHSTRDWRRRAMPAQTRSLACVSSGSPPPRQPTCAPREDVRSPGVSFPRLRSLSIPAASASAAGRRASLLRLGGDDLVERVEDQLALVHVGRRAPLDEVERRRLRGRQRRLERVVIVVLVLCGARLQRSSRGRLEARRRGAAGGLGLQSAAASALATPITGRPRRSRAGVGTRLPGGCGGCSGVCR